MFKVIMAVYIEIHKQCKIKNATLLTVKVGGAYNYHWALKG
jgi:hypothetical protein